MNPQDEINMEDTNINPAPIDPVIPVDPAPVDPQPVPVDPAPVDPQPVPVDPRFDSLLKDINAIKESHNAQVGVLKSLLERVGQTLTDVNADKKMAEHQLSEVAEEDKQLLNAFSSLQQELGMLNSVLMQCNDMTHSFAQQLNGELEAIKTAYGDPSVYIKNVLGDDSL